MNVVQHLQSSSGSLQKYCMVFYLGLFLMSLPKFQIFPQEIIHMHFTK